MIDQTLKLDLNTQSYPIYIGQGLLDNKTLFERHLQGKQVMIVTQKRVPEPYLARLKQSLEAYSPDLHFLPPGESAKNLNAWKKLLDALVLKGHERQTTLLALGGGVVGDVTGFAAACYQRGVNYIQLPTTLIAQVDSAIGGKTGVNHAAGKNLIGAFHHPKAVIADISTLNTLPRREYIAGLAEIIKCALIADAAFFHWLEEKLPALLQREPQVLQEAIYRSAKIKISLVSQDEREQSGARALLNFGHTLGHAVEALLNYKGLLHGEGVGLGLYYAAALSVEMGWLSEADFLRIECLLKASQLPLQLKQPFSPEIFLRYLKRDKKIKDGRLRFVLLKGLGSASLTEEVSERLLLAVLQSGKIKKGGQRLPALLLD